SLDLAAGAGVFYRLKRGQDLAALAASGPLALESFVDAVPLEAPDGEPLRLELESFVAAVRGEAPVPGTGADGREVLDAALRIMPGIERTFPTLAGNAAADAATMRLLMEGARRAGPDSGVS